MTEDSSQQSASMQAYRYQIILLAKAHCFHYVSKVVRTLIKMWVCIYHSIMKTEEIILQALVLHDSLYHG